MERENDAIYVVPELIRLGGKNVKGKGGGDNCGTGSGDDTCTTGFSAVSCGNVGTNPN